MPTFTPASIASAESVPGPSLASPITVHPASIPSATGIMPGPVITATGGPAVDTWAPRITAGAYDRSTGALIVELDDSFARKWQDQFNDTGTAAVSLSNEDPAAALVAYGCVVRFRLDGQTRFAMLVEQRQMVALSNDEEVGEVTTITGRGTLAVFEEAVVAPAFPPTGYAP